MSYIYGFYKLLKVYWIFFLCRLFRILSALGIAIDGPLRNTEFERMLFGINNFVSVPMVNLLDKFSGEWEKWANNYESPYVCVWIHACDCEFLWLATPCQRNICQQLLDWLYQQSFKIQTVCLMPCQCSLIFLHCTSWWNQHRCSQW